MSGLTRAVPRQVSQACASSPPKVASVATKPLSPEPVATPNYPSTQILAPGGAPMSLFCLLKGMVSGWGRRWCRASAERAPSGWYHTPVASTAIALSWGYGSGPGCMLLVPDGGQDAHGETKPGAGVGGGARLKMPPLPSGRSLGGPGNK